MTRNVLYAVVCGAGPASHVDQLIDLAHQRGWEVRVIATPSALDFIDVANLETLTGNQVRSQYRKPGEPRSKPADAVIAAPATYNTINKLALGISDTYALGVLAESIGLGITTVVLPFVNSALASRTPYTQNVQNLKAEGVLIPIGPGGVVPHAPHTGSSILHDFPWSAAWDLIDPASPTTPSNLGADEDAVYVPDRLRDQRP